MLLGKQDHPDALDRPTIEAELGLDGFRSTFGERLYPLFRISSYSFSEWGDMERVLKAIVRRKKDLKEI